MGERARWLILCVAGAGSAGKPGKNFIFAGREDAFGRPSRKELY